MKKILLIIGVTVLAGCSNNEILEIKDDTPIPAITKKGDSYIFLDDLEHRSTTKYMSFDGDKNTLKILFKTRQDDVENINLVFKEKKYPMKELSDRGEEDIFLVEIPVVKDENINYYFEVIDDEFKYYYGEKSSYYSSKIVPFNYFVEEDKRELPNWSDGMIWYSIYVDSFRDGDLENSPIYSEFGPEYYFRASGRLEDGTLRSELISPEKWHTKGRLQGFEITEWGDDWNNPPYAEIEAENRYFPYAIKNTRRYGGDIQGIIEKLDYLEELGVGGINLSPIYYSNTGHKLDTIDYAHISPDYGITNKNSYRELENGLDVNIWTESDKLFQKLVDEIHRKEMKIVLDINFLYVSKEFFALKDIEKNGKTSKYKNWFIWNEGEENAYKTLGNENKVALNLSDKSLQDYLIASTLKWAKGYKSEGIDGYYIKNDLLNKEFLKRWKEALLNINSEFILIGESTGENENNIGKSGFDIIASYELVKWIESYLRDQDKDSIQQIKGELEFETIKTPTWHILESYDTDRFYSSLINLGREVDRLNNYGKDDYINIQPSLIDPSAIKKLKLATLIYLTTNDSSAIYYGSEKGMWGANSPDSRKPMIWEDIEFENETDNLENYTNNREKIAGIFETDLIKNNISYEVKADEDLENFYSKIIEFREFDSELLKKGDLKVLDLDRIEYLEGRLNIKQIPETDVLAYKREYQGRSAIIVTNRSASKKEVEIPIEGSKGYTDYLTGERYNLKGDKIKLELEGYGYIVLYRKINLD